MTNTEESNKVDQKPTLQKDVITEEVPKAQTKGSEIVEPWLIAQFPVLKSIVVTIKGYFKKFLFDFTILSIAVIYALNYLLGVSLLLHHTSESTNILKK